MRSGIISSASTVACIKRALTTTAKPSSSIPVSKGLPMIGNLFALWRAGGAPHLHRYIDDGHRKHGAIFKEKLGADVHAVFVSDPEVMRAVFAQEGKHPVHVLPEAWTVYNELYGCTRGLFFMNGVEWLHHRRVMNNFFLKAGSRDFIAEAVEASAGSLNLHTWEDDLEEALYRWSLDTIVAVMLGRSQYINARQATDAKLEDVSRKIKLIFETSARLQFVPVRLAQRMGLRVWKDFVYAVDDAMNDASELVYELMTISQDQKIETIQTEDVGVIGLMREAKMAPSDIIRIVVDLVLAAGDTTAYTMQWLLYSLAKNPQYQNSYEANDIKNYIRETLRLYPVAPFLTRINAEQDIIAGKYNFSRNTLLIYSLYTVGRNEQYFNQAGLFLPNRWQSRTPRMVQASLPFAMGARSCIGRRIAELQLTKTLQNVLKDYSIRLKKPNDDVEMILKMISVPSKPIELEFIKK